MLTEDINIVTSTICVEQSLTFAQCNNFVSIMDEPAALLDERLLVCINLLSMLCGLPAFHLISGSDKLEYYTCSLRS